MINKSLVTNLLAMLVLLAGLFLELPWLSAIGLFAVSGAITNWLAIHMLFERVPGLYGSGVIERNFVHFKQSIANMIMVQFFTQQNIQQYLQQTPKQIDFAAAIEPMDLSVAFTALKQAVMESSFGSMLGMFGGEEALDPLQEPFERKMKKALKSIASSEAFMATLNEGLDDERVSQSVQTKVQSLIESRLEALTPEMVKELVQQMIKKHLGWLVVWGGVFGGVIGLASTLVAS